MDVYILRHGKAEGARPGMADADRRLTKKGREEIAAAGRWMKRQDLRIGLIAASPLVRAQETAAIIAAALGLRDSLVTWEVLAPGGNPDAVFDLIGKQPDPCTVLLVGHEPLLSAFISRIITGNDTAAIVMTKGSLAKIREFSPEKSPFGELHWLITGTQMAAMR